MRLLTLLIAGVAIAAAPVDRPVQSLDLSRPFAARSPWRLTVTQAPDMPDPIMDSSEQVPGAESLCLSRDGGRTCDARVSGSLRLPGSDDLYAEPHELRRLAIVHPRADLPLLLVQLGSLHSVNGNQRVGMQLYAYDRATDAFRSVYRGQTNRNNNEEIRYVDAGPLRGAVIVAEPTPDAPFGFWITVSRPAATGQYRQALRYRSVTRYGDGNALAVIDSDMPALQQRLGLWRPGRPLPVPAHCPAPHLVRMALWCTR